MSAPRRAFVHQGMTSSDVLDTCLAVQLNQAADLLLADLDALLAALKRRAFEHKYTPDHRPQPRHPRRADDLRPEARRALCRIRPQPRAPRRRAQGRSRPARSPARSAPSPISTRVVEAYVAKKLGLEPEPISTQIIPRDRHAQFFMALALIAAGDRAARHRDPPSAAHRIARGRGIFLAGARRAPRRCRTSATRCCRRT